jgi:hypothetical protein
VFPVRAGARAEDKCVGEIAIVIRTYATSVAERGGGLCPPSKKFSKIKRF